jgi:hypothetical protein
VTENLTSREISGAANVLIQESKRTPEVFVNRFYHTSEFENVFIKSGNLKRLSEGIDFMNFILERTIPTDNGFNIHLSTYTFSLYPYEFAITVDDEYNLTTSVKVNDLRFDYDEYEEALFQLSTIYDLSFLDTDSINSLVLLKNEFLEHLNNGLF